MTVTRIGVIGAGTMGSGIAQTAAASGHEVVLVDMDEHRAAQGLARIRESLERKVSAGKLDVPARDGILSRLEVSGELAKLQARIEHVPERRDHQHGKWAAGELPQVAQVLQVVDRSLD